MGLLYCLYCVTFLQIVFGQIPTKFNVGQNARNAGQVQLPFTSTNIRGLGPTQLARDATNGVPAVNQLARNTAINGNNLANAANANFANFNTNIASINQANENLINQNNLANLNKINPNSNVPLATSKLVNPNLVNANLPAPSFANNLASANIASLGGANNANLGHAGPLSNLINANFARPNLAQQMYPSTRSAGQISRNVASPYTTPNAVNANYANYGNFANSRFSMANSYPASGLADNLASGLARTNLANGNIDNAAGNLANGFNPNGFNFGIGGNPFTIISGSPGSQPFNIQVVADALEIGGTLSVAGKMPIYGTVTLNGNLQTEGVASVNYGCTSKRNV